MAIVYFMQFGRSDQTKPRDNNTLHTEPRAARRRGPVNVDVITLSLMEIKIHNYLSCSHRLEADSGDWDSIVILDSSLDESEFVSRHSRNSLQLKFDDVTSPTPHKIEPSHELIAAALNFGIASEKLIVCCRAGQSRSSATAFSIAYEKLGKMDAFKCLNPKRHSPNSRILQIADEMAKNETSRAQIPLVYGGTLSNYVGVRGF